jgi:hypothetical protein
VQNLRVAQNTNPNCHPSNPARSIAFSLSFPLLIQRKDMTKLNVMATYLYLIATERDPKIGPTKITAHQFCEYQQNLSKFSTKFDFDFSLKLER